MATTHYYIDKGYCTQHKNNLEKEMAVYLDSLHGKLIVAKDLETLKSDIIQKSKQLNEKHKRCRPLELSFHKSYNNKNDFHLSGFHSVVFDLKGACLTGVKEDIVDKRIIDSLFLDVAVRDCVEQLHNDKKMYSCETKAGELITKDNEIFQVRVVITRRVTDFMGDFEIKGLKTSEK